MIYRDRGVAGKIRDAGIPGTFLGYGYVNGKKGSRVRVGNTNKVSTFRNVVCGVFPSGSARVQLLQPDEQPRDSNEPTAEPREANTTPDATITTLDNEQEVEAQLRANASAASLMTNEITHPTVSHYVRNVSAE